MSSKRESLHKQQAGIASLLFTLVMMIVITIIVLSFAQLARRNQREALDTQLSTQAYYAAETGVNDVTQAINDLAKAGTTAVDNVGCSLNTTYTNYFNANGVSQQLDPSTAYNCIRVDSTPDNLKATLDTSRSKILNIEPTTSIKAITLSWDAGRVDLDKTGCPTAGSVTFPSAWLCPWGVLRFDLVDVSGSSLTRAGLLSKTMSAFAVPTSATSSTYTVTNQQGLQLNAKCDLDADGNPATCSVTITLPTAGTNTYALRVMTKYLGANLTVTPVPTTAGTPVSFKHSQAVVDVTGRAQDVLRRLQVRVPLNGANGGYSDYAIASQGSICKRFAVTPEPYFADDDPATISDSGCPTYTTPD